MAEVLFFIAAIGAVAGAVGTVSLRNPFYAVLALVCHLLALAALLLLLRAAFVAAAHGLVAARGRAMRGAVHRDPGIRPLRTGRRGRAVLGRARQGLRHRLRHGGRDG